MKHALAIISVALFLIAVQADALSDSLPGNQIYENRYLRIEVLPGWTAQAPQFTDPLTNRTEVDITQGRYILSVNPLYVHASGIVGGHFGDATSGMPSVSAVIRLPEQQSWGACFQSDRTKITDTLVLNNLYTDGSEQTWYGEEEGLLQGADCNFPADGQPAWFGSFYTGSTAGENGHEYVITLAYDTMNVDLLPKKDSPELKRVLNNVGAMLKSLVLKPIVTISRIDPQSAPPGATVTIHGTGFDLPGADFAVVMKEFPEAVGQPTVSPNGSEVRFQVPMSVNIVGYSAPALSSGVKPGADFAKCPVLETQKTNFCGIPIPPRTYEMFLYSFRDSAVSNHVSFSVTPPRPAAVSVSLIYPNYMILPGETITIKGAGFTPSGNTVVIGSAVISNLASPDGQTIAFEAPVPAGVTPSNYVLKFQASVSNANGISNPITVLFRGTRSQYLTPEERRSKGLIQITPIPNIEIRITPAPSHPPFVEP